MKNKTNKQIDTTDYQGQFANYLKSYITRVEEGGHTDTLLILKNILKEFHSIRIMQLKENKTLKYKNNKLQKQIKDLLTKLNHADTEERE